MHQRTQMLRGWPKRGLTWERYVQLEQEYEEAEAYEARSSYVDTGWEEELRKIQAVREAHPEWHAQYQASKR